MAYRKRMGYAPTPSERGAIAGAAWSCYSVPNSFWLCCQGPWWLYVVVLVSSGPLLPALLAEG